MVSIKWNDMTDGVRRARVPGGWLVTADLRNSAAQGMAFVPDPEHAWI